MITHLRTLLSAGRRRAARRGRILPVALSAALVLGSLTSLLATTAPPARAATLPSGFRESIVFSGLTNPTAVRFASDGRVFVAEKRGIIKVFDSLTDTTPTTFADLNVNVYNFWDRGLLGMALHPHFPATPYVYVLYTYDHELGATAPAPRWGTPGVYSDPCPTPPGPTGTGGCMVSGRLSRLQASGNTMTGGEQVLIEDWCQQYPSHSVGTVEFGADGSLYASAGDGASFEYVDYGQTGSPLNPCGDPPAEGGALRSQDLRTAGDQAVTLDGTIIRVDPATGAGLPDNPLASSSNANTRRVIAHGFRNPFRFTRRPATDELWVGDVGWSDWEEINRISDPLGTVENFGWPCYEGPGRQGGYDAADLNICENLYAQAGAVAAPYHAYRHADKVVANETCPEGSSSIAGLQFEFAGGGNYPTEYQDALFFADYSRDCIWAMLKGTNGLPAPGLIRTFAAGAANPVNLETGPGGDLFYVDFDGGTIRRISYTAGASSCPIGQYKASYFANQTLSGTPVTERCESAIDYDWGSGSPSGSGVGPDNFSVRWVGTHSFATTGTYTFTATADDGVRVYLDGTLVIDQWKDQSATTYTASRTVTAGNHELKVEYYENGGDAVARFSVTAAANLAPTAVATATPTTGSAPLTVAFDGRGSSDPDGDTLSYAWDLDGNGTYNDASTATASYTYTTDGVRIASLRVTDSRGASDTDSVTISVGNAPPTATINTPAAGTTWRVGDSISFSGSATDLQDGSLPASRLSWRVLLQHCPSNCHTHEIQTFSGVASGSFVAPSHEYPSYLELELTATDSGGLTHTVTRRLDPRTVVLTFQTTPGGLQLAVNGTIATASFTRTVIVGSTNGITAPSPQTKGGKSYVFQSWSDGGAQSHTVVAPATATTYTARFSFK